MAVRPTTTRLRLNDQTYEFGLTLYNPQGSTFPINTAALVKLTIEENSNDWYKRGSLTIRNSNNVIERRPNELISPDANYKFRNDGRDFLLVNIKPVYDGAADGLTEDPFPSEGWELAYMFSVYDTEDIMGDNQEERYLKLYFWEFDFQLFIETTSSVWDTNTVLYDQHPELRGKSSVLPDDKRKVPTGLAIKSLIQSVLDDSNVTQTFSDSWDPGASTIFYCGPTNNNSIDDLDYLFARHVASKKFGSIEGDVPMMYRDRYTKQWSLTSLATILSYAVEAGQAGIAQLEQFFISSTTATSVLIPSRLRTPQSNIQTRNLDLGPSGMINNFQYVDMAALDNTFALISRPVSSNTIKEKQFVFDLKDTDIENVKGYFQDNYVSKFSNNKFPTALFSLNTAKKEKIIYKQPYSYGATRVDRYPEGRNSILKSGFFLNQCLCFTVIGSTVRRCNVFIGLDRKTGSVDADFDEKLLGQWYVTKVTHDFTPDGYTNTIAAVKPHSNKDLRITDDIM